MVTRHEEAGSGKHNVVAGGFSRRGLDRMHANMHGYVERGQVPGLVTALGCRGEVQVDAIGKLEFGGERAMQHDTIFRLASTTKPITAVAAMTLVEDCKLRLDDPVDEWLPELRDRKVLRSIQGPLEDTVPATRPITLRDLLTFRSGYGEVMLVAWNCPMQHALAKARLPLSDWPFDGTADEFMKRLGALPLAHQPGDRWLYHMGAEIVGVLVSRVAGKSLGEFMRERIFEPLGMKDTGFGVPDSKRDRLAACYYTDPSTGKATILDEAGDTLFNRLRVFESGAGGLVSTADDLLAFGQMMLHRGKYGRERILSRSAVELMTIDHLTPEQKVASTFFPGFWDARGWGLGLGTISRRYDVGLGPGAFGWDGAFSTSLYIDPNEDMVGVLLAQRRPEVPALPRVVFDFWASAYQAIDD
jgi:CubicO group peptidase (beta-lactamase class C family)